MNRDLGQRTSYLEAVGIAVYDATDRHVGIVSHVLAVEELDVFDGFVVARVEQPVAHRFADADQVGEIYERGVLLTVAWEALQEPRPNAAALEVGADDMEPDALGDRLHRAWSMIRGGG